MHATLWFWEKVVLISRGFWRCPQCQKFDVQVCKKQPSPFGSQTVEHTKQVASSLLPGFRKMIKAYHSLILMLVFNVEIAKPIWKVCLVFFYIIIVTILSSPLVSIAIYGQLQSNTYHPSVFSPAELFLAQGQHPGIMSEPHLVPIVGRRWSIFKKQQFLKCNCHSNSIKIKESFTTRQ